MVFGLKCDGVNMTWNRLVPCWQIKKKKKKDPALLVTILCFNNFSQLGGQ